jgi:hypothetical protein
MMARIIFINTFFKCFIFFEIYIEIYIFYNHKLEVFESEEEENKTSSIYLNQSFRRLIEFLIFHC